MASLAYLSLLLLLVCVSLTSSDALAWQDKQGVGWQKSAADPPWKPHTGSVATALSDGSVLLTGGQAGRHGGANFDCFNCSKEVWHFTPKEAKWDNLTADVPWDPRWGHSVVTLADDSVFMFFGCCEPNRPTVMFRDVWTFNPMKGYPWTKLDEETPLEGIQAPGIAAYETEIWITGGWSQRRGTLNIVYVFNADPEDKKSKESTAPKTRHELQSKHWTVKSINHECEWPRRSDHASAISPDGRWLIIFGGQHEENGGALWNRLADTWRVELATYHSRNWKQLGDLREPRSSPAVAMLSTGWIVTVGGHYINDKEVLEVNQSDVQGMQEHHEKTPFWVYNDVLALDVLGGSKEWKILEMEAAWPGRDDCGATASKDGSLLLFGGGTLYGGGDYHRDVWKLDNAAEVYGLVKSERIMDIASKVSIMGAMPEWARPVLAIVVVVAVGFFSLNFMVGKKDGKKE